MITQQEAAQEILRRQKAQKDFLSFCLLTGLQPAAHHKLLITHLQRVAEATTPMRLIILMPRGAAKSTYTSDRFPAWFLSVKPTENIIACSHSYELAESFGKRGRNLVENFDKVLGYSLKSDSRAAGEWHTNKGGAYYCAGVGTGLAGRRGGFGLIDDSLGSQEDADSKIVRDKQWDWYLNDFWPCLKPYASVVIVATPKHEDDLIARLLAKEGERKDGGLWEVIRVPYFAEDEDPLGRAVGERLWPEWFTNEHESYVLSLPSQVRASNYQLRPAPEDGDYFKDEDVQEYSREKYDELYAKVQSGEYPVYCASDHAVSTRQSADFTCMGGVTIDTKKNIYILPDLVWKRIGPKDTVNEMITLAQLFKPVYWWAEKDHIKQSIAPFLEDSMREQEFYIRMDELTSNKDLQKRAQPIRGYMQRHKVFFPAWTKWYSKAKDEMMKFPHGSHDDFVSFLSLLGRGISKMVRPEFIMSTSEDLHVEFRPTYKWLKQQTRRQELAALQDA